MSAVVTELLILSLSARRAWIEIAYGALDGASEIVALRKESVDRNWIPESTIKAPMPSLSARRAWIEMSIMFVNLRVLDVALRKESVDRNFYYADKDADWVVALRKESVDRNCFTGMT